jgi:hypothetical protein
VDILLTKKTDKRISNISSEKINQKTTIQKKIKRYVTAQTYRTCVPQIVIDPTPVSIIEQANNDILISLVILGDIDQVKNHIIQHPGRVNVHYKDRKHLTRT